MRHLLAAALLAVLPAAARSETGFHDRTAEISSETYRYQVYVPSGWSADKKWPVILFLHGAGQRGRDGHSQTTIGLPQALLTRAADVPAVVVMPQCPEGKTWSSPDMRALALKTLEQSVAEFSGDPDRLYATGLSMGGYGTWELAAARPGLFAAYVVVCGGMRAPNWYPDIHHSYTLDPAVPDPYAALARRVGTTPVRIYQGDADTVVPVEEARRVYAALKISDPNARMTEYHGVGHDSWVKAYAEPDLFSWLLAQHLPHDALLVKAPAPRGPDLGYLWPTDFPKISTESARPRLTDELRAQGAKPGLNGVAGLKGETVSKAVALFPKDRALPGVVVFELESGPDRGVHRCEALGRGRTSSTPKEGWTPADVREPDGRSTRIYYAPETADGGATLPGIYELRNIRPTDYRIKVLNKDVAGDEALVRRLTDGGGVKPYYSGVWKTWFPRDPRYAGVVPVDLIWSEAYQPLSQGAGLPVYESASSDKDPEQIRHNPRYYFGPYGRSGFAVHTDRWSDPETAADPARASQDEARSFLFRNTNGCVKVRPDCLQLLNAFIDEQSAKGRRVLLDVREIR